MMIKKTRIWESKRATHEHYEAQSLLVKRYRQFVPSDEYRRALSASLHFYEHLRCSHLVVDSAFAGPATESDIVWACNQYEAFIADKQIDKILVVRPYSVYAQYTILEFQRRLYGCLPILVYPTLQATLDVTQPKLISSV